MDEFFLDSVIKINLSSIIFTFWSTHNTQIEIEGLHIYLKMVQVLQNFVIN